MDILVAVELDADGLEEVGKLLTGWFRQGIEIEIVKAEVGVGIELCSVVFGVFEETALDADAEGRDLASVEVERVFVKGAVRVLPRLVFGGVGDEDAEGFVVL